LPQEDWDWVYGINFWGVLHGLRAFVPLMLEQGDECHIVNTASIAGFTPGGSIYGSTKKGVVGLSETLVAQLAMAEASIGVTVLCPSWVRTEIGNSSRNRTGDFKDTLCGDDVPEESRAMTRALAAAVRDGQDPLDIGDMVVDAIRQNRFYQFTDHIWDDAIEMRPGYVLAGTPPTPSKESLRMRSQMMDEDA
jgi:NAD(P)-dependent dehydrogenase (short-subunit alcohol dehydrogenase family)